MSLPPRRWFLYASVALAFAVGVWFFGFRAETREAPSPYGSRSSWRNPNLAVPVAVAAAERQDLLVHLRAIGTVVPLNTVTVRSRVEGELLRLAFQEGQQVEKGQLLAEIDPAPYRIRLAQAQAQLRQNEAQLMSARSDLERLRQLNAQNLVTQQQLEAQQALVAEREAAVAADQAQVDDAQRQLAYTKIEAPLTGRVGLRQIDPGNLIRPGDANGLVVITQMRPIAVMFTVPEIDLHKVLEPVRAGERLHVEAWDRNERNLLATGTLDTMDNQIDATTGTLRLKAEFPNADERLFPNQFVNVKLRVRTIEDALVVPAAAIQYGSRGTYVFTITPENKALVRDVELGPSDGERQSILRGLQLGERVVLEGLDRLRDGRPVQVVGEETEPARKAGELSAQQGAEAAAKKRKKGA